MLLFRVFHLMMMMLWMIFPIMMILWMLRNKAYGSVSFFFHNSYPALTICLPLQVFSQYFWPFFSIILSYPNDLDNSYARSRIPMWMHVQPCFSILPHTHSINIPPVVSTLLQKSSKTGKLMKCFLEVFVMTVLVFFQVENIYLSSSSKNKLVHFHIYLFYY